MKSSVLVDVSFDGFGNLDVFREMMPEREIINWKDSDNRPADLGGINYALGWEPQRGLFASMADLKVMFSVGAGVDHMIEDETLPDLPLVRFVDESLTSRMSEWICLQCLLHFRQHLTYHRQQTQRIWAEVPQPDASQMRVGIMGLGVLGQDAARNLKMLGFQVNGWSRTKKDLHGIKCFDSDGLDEFLSVTDILVGLLPLTPQTIGIFNRSLFTRLAKTTPIGAPIFINAGRGKSQVEADIVEAIKNGTLKGASLDVFDGEPLAPDSPLWAMDNVVLTPHIASVSNAQALAAHMKRQIERFEAGLELEHVVDKAVGY